MVRPFIWAGCFLPALAAYPERRERRRSSCLALLRTGFAVPSSLPWTRCALAAPFHPCRPEKSFRLGRYVFCGAFRRLAAPGCCPAFLLFGVRTFLPFAPCRREKAAARPTRLRGIIALIRRTVDGKFFWEVSVVPKLCFASLIDSSDSGFSSVGIRQAELGMTHSQAELGNDRRKRGGCVKISPKSKPSPKGKSHAFQFCF